MRNIRRDIRRKINSDKFIMSVYRDTHIERDIWLPIYYQTTELIKKQTNMLYHLKYQNIFI